MRRGLGAAATSVVAGVGAVLLLSGCGAQEKASDTAASVSEKAIEKAVNDAAEGDGVEDVEVDRDAGTVEIKGEDGTLLLGADLAMPDGFPETLPLPEGGHAINAVHAEGGVFEVTMSVVATDLAEHEEHLRRALESAGYAIEETAEETVDGVEQRVVHGVGHDTQIALRLATVMEKPSVHYSVKMTN